jgi:hypothetical protein
MTDAEPSEIENEKHAVVEDLIISCMEIAEAERCGRESKAIMAKLHSAHAAIQPRTTLIKTMAVQPAKRRSSRSKSHQRQPNAPCVPQLLVQNTISNPSCKAKVLAARSNRNIKLMSEVLIALVFREVKF